MESCATGAESGTVEPPTIETDEPNADADSIGLEAVVADNESDPRVPKDSGPLDGDLVNPQSGKDGTESDEPPPGIPPSARFLIAKLRAGGDLALVYQSIDTLASLSASELAVVYQLLKGILGKKLNQDDFRKAVREARSRQKKSDRDNRIRSSEHPYRATRDGIIRIKARTDGTEEVVPLTNFNAAITSNIAEDDGVETRRSFGIDAELHGKHYALAVAASRFSSMEWAIESIGPNAIIHPNQKEWARAAVQTLSTDVREQHVYVHTGWRKVGNSMLYLHGGGAIGAGGAVPQVDVRLSGALVHYALMLPRSRPDLIQSVRASLHIRRVAPADITLPLLAAAYRAVLRPCDFSTWLAGPTGVFKSELAALAQQHYGAAMDARRLPGNFASTGNALEVLAFAVKDGLLVVDDFAPQGGIQDIARYHAAADRILRAAGNSQGRGRLSADTRLREAKPPRGLILATGEDMPRGQSIRGRTLMIEVGPGDVRTDTLTQCQVSAANGAYATAMGGFVQWIAGQYDLIQTRIQARVLELRSQATQAHSRTPGIIADLCAGFELFLDFAVAMGAIKIAHKDVLQKACWAALSNVAKAQRRQQDDSEPAGRFLELLRAAVLSGQAYVTDLKGGPPTGAELFGWQLVGARDQERWAARGRCVGWLDDTDLYLEPTASFGVAQELGRSTGEPLVVGQTTLHKRLNEKGRLVSTDIARGTLTVRRCVCGKSVSVLHLHGDVLSSSATIDAAGEEGPDSGSQSGVSSTL